MYAAFGTKRDLLADVVRAAVRGDEAAPVTEQRGPAAAMAAAGQHDQLRLFAFTSC